VSQLNEKISKEVRDQGMITFARFMELALYCPVYGYYERETDTIGRRGDYFTSVSVGPLFGQLLACRFAEWAGCGGPGAIRIAEAGAHRGELAGDILAWFREQRPDLFERVEYWLIEPSERRRSWQRQTLVDFSARVRWADTFEEVRAGNAAAGLNIIFSNELLDAFPVHRLGWDSTAAGWFEWGVSERDKGLEFVRMPGVPRITGPELPAGLARLLPDGFVREVCPAAVEWWRQAASALGHGKLMTIDYGLTTEELLQPERTEGTSRAYHRHQVSADLLACPGEQDLTAHVDFTVLQNMGEAVGLKTETFVSQPQFLTGIAEKIWKGETRFGEWAPKHTRQFQTLTHPDHLGRGFRVLVQANDSAAVG
jgi:SAM-dependent MidA family methyltransferase